MELAYKDVRGEKEGKCSRENLGFLRVEIREQRNRETNKQDIYMFKGKHGSKSKNKLPCTKRNIKLYGGIELGN